MRQPHDGTKYRRHDVRVFVRVEMRNAYSSIANLHNLGAKFGVDVKRPAANAANKPRGDSGNGRPVRRDVP